MASSQLTQLPRTVYCSDTSSFVTIQRTYRRSVFPTLARQIINDPNHRGLFDIEKETPDADPFVIALAIVRQRQAALLGECVVVSDEARAEQGVRPRIPRVCRDPAYNVPCIRTLEMFEREGWKL